jgi:hypothetical protein
VTTNDCKTIAALGELGVRYARYVDRREFEKLAELFTPDASIAVFPGDPETHQALYAMAGLAQIQQAFQLLRRYQGTFHFVGQQLVVEASADSASGETYCIARHFHNKQGKDHCYTMFIRYQDRFAKVNGAWRMLQRQLIVDRTEGEDVDA